MAQPRTAWLSQCETQVNWGDCVLEIHGNGVAEGNESAFTSTIERKAHGPTWGGAAPLKKPCSSTAIRGYAFEVIKIFTGGDAGSNKLR